MQKSDMNDRENLASGRIDDTIAAMRLLGIGIIVGLHFGSPSICIADDMPSDGNRLYEEYQHYKNGETTYLAGHYMGYVQGVADAINGELFCIPNSVKNMQLFDIVGKSLEQYPELRHKTKSWLVATALRKSYPCARPSR